MMKIIGNYLLQQSALDFNCSWYMKNQNDLYISQAIR
jgi:hypothetical protein